jgi:8-oxo-dGTP pyrophosphatase MutT (NUDIX family)
MYGTGMSNDPPDNRSPSADTNPAIAGVAVPSAGARGADTKHLAHQLTEALNRVDRDMSHPNTRPRDAATLIVIDRSGEVPKVLLGLRHARHKFLPGKFVFPGGRVEPTDRAANVASELDPRVAARLMTRTQRPSLAKARAFAIAAIRETFEETGLILGKTSGELPDAAGGHPPPSAASRLLPDLAAMHFIARAITPPRRTRRFDTRFFALDANAITGQVEGVVGPDAELIELVWLPLTEAERLDMPPITKAVLGELELRIAAGFTHDLAVPFYRWVGRGFTRALL